MAVPLGPGGGAGLGGAPAIGVLAGDAFATSWRGLTFSLIDISLQYGNIRVNGHSATIRCSVSGKKARHDIHTISKFIKKHFRLGGRIEGRRMTSQWLVRHIISNLPGIFAIEP